MAKAPVYYASQGTVEAIDGRAVVEFESGGATIRVSLDANATLLLSLRCRKAANSILADAAQNGAQIIPFARKRKKRKAV